jgi:methionyl-tRNA formyltransferase
MILLPETYNNPLRILVLWTSIILSVITHMQQNGVNFVIKERRLMRLIFMGSPSPVISPLTTLINGAKAAGHELVAVVSQPARRVGRGKKVEDPPVAAFAKENGITTLQPESAKSSDFLDKLKILKPDIIITAAYGQILNKEFLATPTRGTINIHPSLLPAYRGATPVPAALFDGRTKTGVTILFTVRKLDAGNIILQEESEIEADETTETLTNRLFERSGELLLKAIETLQDPSFEGEPQNAELVTHCRKIEKQDGLIDWALPSSEIVNRFRACQPWPGSYTFSTGTRIAITKLALSDVASSAPSGSFHFDKKQKCLFVSTKDSCIAITKLKPSGRKEIDATAFWNGLKQRENPSFSNEEKV